MDIVSNKVAPLFSECTFPVYVYFPDDKSFFQITKGESEKKPAPANMLEHLENDSTFFQSFKKGDTFMVFYFLRMETDGRKFVIMINSDKERKNVNSAASSMFHKMKLLEETIQAELNEANESVSVLRKSRQKMLKLLDGLVMPLFSISPDFEVINVNKELAQLLDIDNIPSLLNKKCYEVIHGRTEPCTFCRMEEIKNAEETSGQTIELDFSGRHYHFEHHMFPIYSQTGEMDEIGEFMIDVSENYRNLESIEKYKEKVKHIQKAEIDKMNEIGELKKAYRDLEKNYDDMFVKNKKMSKAIERLMEDNNVNELIRLRQENRDTKNKLVRSAMALKNFQQTLDIQQTKYTELSKKTIYQMERLINTVNKKSMVTEGEVLKLLKTVTDDVRSLRKTLKIEAPPE